MHSTNITKKYINNSSFSAQQIYVVHLYKSFLTGYRNLLYSINCRETHNIKGHHMVHAVNS